jgi:hypothetical protein
MALIACPECGTQVSDTAAACPSCGRASKKAADSAKSMRIMVALIGGVIGLVIMIGALSSLGH